MTGGGESGGCCRYRTGTLNPNIRSRFRPMPIRSSSESVPSLETIE